MILENYEMTKGLAHYHQQDNVTQVLNIISETMTQTLEGKQLNNFVTYMKDR